MRSQGMRIILSWCATVATTSALLTHSINDIPNALHVRSKANNVALRILPIGDSITWGYGSSDGNG